LRTFLRDELVGFLEAVDAALDQPLEVVIIGGAAAAVHYGIELGTHDIDTWTNVQEELAKAVEQARAGTGLPLPFAKSGVADGPYDFESRLERALPHLQRLVVKVPEKHDLALMKVVRGYEHDLDGIEAIHRRSPLDLQTLLQRYRDEMGAVVGDPRKLRGQLLALVGRLFPDQVDAVAHEL
jgi:hypothetical protein